VNGEAETPGDAMNREREEMNEERSSKIFTLPNMLSFSRILLTPVFIWAALQRKPWLAFAIFLFAGATDALDGFTARFFRLKTDVGLWLDPMGDKILLTAAFVVLTVPGLGGPNVLPLWLTVICVGRDVLISLGTLIYIGIRGRTTFKPTLPGKASTVLEVAALLVVLLYNGLGTAPGFLPSLYILTAGLTGLSGVHYIILGMSRFFKKEKTSGS
jgi:cardiolipin synthase